jgi:hypothetical protein
VLAKKSKLLLNTSHKGSWIKWWWRKQGHNFLPMDMRKKSAICYGSIAIDGILVWSHD